MSASPTQKQQQQQHYLNEHFVFPSRPTSSTFMSNTHSPLTESALKAFLEIPFLERILLELSDSAYLGFDANKFRQMHNNGTPLDPITTVERNMEIIALFFQKTKSILQEAYTVDNIEVIFSKRQQLTNIHQLIEQCNAEMEHYMSVLEAEKSNPAHYTAKPPSSKLQIHSSSQQKKIATWALHSPNNRLVSVADKIGQAIPEMRELYILSQNLLKRLDLSAEWNELYNIITRDLETESAQLEEELATIKEQVTSSGLSVLGPSARSCTTNLLSASSKHNLTEMEFLLQAVLDNPTTSGCRTIPYLNGAQKIVVTRFYGVQTKLRPLDIAVKCLPDRLSLFENKAINVYPKSLVKLNLRYTELRERCYGLSKECLKLSEELGDELHWNEIFVGLCANADRAFSEYERAAAFDDDKHIEPKSQNSSPSPYKISIKTKGDSMRSLALRDFAKVMSLLNGMVKQKAIKNPRLICKRDILQEKLNHIKQGGITSSYYILFDPTHSKSSMGRKSTLRARINATSSKYCLLPLPRKSKPGISQPTGYVDFAPVSSRNVSGASTESNTTTLSEDSMLSSTASHYRTTSSTSPFTSPASSPKPSVSLLKTPVLHGQDKIPGSNLTELSLHQHDDIPATSFAGENVTTTTPPTPPYISTIHQFNAEYEGDSKSQIDLAYDRPTSATRSTASNDSKVTPTQPQAPFVNLPDPFVTEFSPDDSSKQSTVKNIYNSSRLISIPAYVPPLQESPLVKAGHKLKSVFTHDKSLSPFSGLATESPTLDPRVVGTPDRIDSLISSPVTGSLTPTHLLPELEISPSKMAQPSPKYSVQIVGGVKRPLGNESATSSSAITTPSNKTSLMRGRKLSPVSRSRRSKNRSMDKSVKTSLFFPHDETTVTPGRVSQMHRYRNSNASVEDVDRAASVPSSALRFHKPSSSTSSRTFQIPAPQRLSNLFSGGELMFALDSPLSHKRQMSESVADEDAGKTGSTSGHSKRPSTSGFFARLSHTFTPETEFHIPSKKASPEASQSCPTYFSSSLALYPNNEDGVDPKDGRSGDGELCDEQQYSDSAKRYRVMPSNLVIHKAHGNQAVGDIISSTPRTATAEEEAESHGPVLEVAEYVQDQISNTSKGTVKDGSEGFLSGTPPLSLFIPFTRAHSRPSSVASFSSVFSYSSSLAGNTSSSNIDSGNNTSTSGNNRPQVYDSYIVPSPTAPTVFLSTLATEARLKKPRAGSGSTPMSRSNSSSSYESLKMYQNRHQHHSQSQLYTQHEQEQHQPTTH